MSAGKIDWAGVHEQIAKAGEAIEKGGSPGRLDREAVLKARAEMLAREPEETKTEDSLEVVEFLLGGEQYGIETSCVREVYPIKDYTPVPCTPPFVLGLVNLRGQIISVIDIRKFFDMPDQGITDLNKVIVIHDDTMEFGILADSILGVRAIPQREIQPPLPTLVGIREEFLFGVTAGQTAVLDARKLLADKNLIIHEDV